jgi:hypothetical protein
LPDIYLADEFWPGTFISISILTYVKRWRWIAPVAWILSLLIRELALPFIAVMLIILSLHERKYKEAFICASGIAVFLIMMVIHTSHIKDFVRPDNVYAFTQWITMGGWKFVLETASMHPYLFLVSDWFIAVFVPFMFLGLLGWGGTRLENRFNSRNICFDILIYRAAFQSVLGCTICEFITTWHVICA